jgi:hypothetical protein
LATERVLKGVGLVLRRYHDAVSGFELPPGSAGTTAPIREKRR